MHPWIPTVLYRSAPERISILWTKASQCKPKLFRVAWPTRTQTHYFTRISILSPSLNSQCSLFLSLFPAYSHAIFATWNGITLQRSRKCLQQNGGSPLWRSVAMMEFEMQTYFTLKRSGGWGGWGFVQTRRLSLCSSAKLLWPKGGVMPAVDSPGPCSEQPE